MLNTITVMGRLTRDPELRTTQSGVSVTSFTVACERDYTQGTQRETDFIDCVAWRQTGEFVSKYFTKGGMIVVDGRLQSRKWQDHDGNKRVNWEVNADHVYFGENRRDDAPRAGYRPAGSPVDVERPQSFDGFREMPGTGGKDNPFSQAPAKPSAFQQAGLWDDENDGELPF